MDAFWEAAARPALEARASKARSKTGCNNAPTSNCALASTWDSSVKPTCRQRPPSHENARSFFLAPDLVKAAINGRLPHGMGVARLTDLPAEWSRQREMRRSASRPTWRSCFGTSFILRYDSHGTEAPKVIEQRIELSFVPAAFAGAPAYFLCPGAECGRRVSVLYFRRGTFRCRQCHDLAYESQRENARKRARRRADKLRARLRWPQRRALALPIMIKPKGMWSSTFEHLRGYAIAAESVATGAQVGHWARLLGRLERRKRRTQ
jgi:hypothetical protein